MRRVKKNGQGVTKRVGKLPCKTFTQVLPLPPCIDHRATELTAEVPEITKAVVHHIQTSLARAPYNIDDFGAYQAAALSVRDNLIVSPWSHYPRIGLSQDRGARTLSNRSPTSTFQRLFLLCPRSSCFTHVALFS